MEKRQVYIGDIYSYIQPDRDPILGEITQISNCSGRLALWVPLSDQKQIGHLWISLTLLQRSTFPSSWGFVRTSLPKMRSNDEDMSKMEKRVVMVGDKYQLPTGEVVVIDRLEGKGPYKWVTRILGMVNQIFREVTWQLTREGTLPLQYKYILIHAPLERLSEVKHAEVELPPPYQKVAVAHPNGKKADVWACQQLAKAFHIIGERIAKYERSERSSTAFPQVDLSHGIQKLNLQPPSEPYRRSNNWWSR